MSSRYQRTFYYRERLQQWCCQEPKMDEDLMDMMQYEVESGKYGPAKDLTRGDVLWMLREHGWAKYRENWKTILRHLSGRSLCMPDDDLTDRCSRVFAVVSRKLQTVSGILKGSKGKRRKNMMHVNYVHRKILEGFGIYEWHREFPLLRTPSKVAELDDAAENIFGKIGIPFTRTAVVAIPKCRQKLKRKGNACDLERWVSEELDRLYAE